MLNVVTRISICLFLGSFVLGCVPFAFPTGIGDPEPYKDENLAFLEVGKSTKSQVGAEMPGPMQSLDDDVWLYVQEREEDEWNIGVISVGGDGSRTIGTTDFRYLLIRFDENGIVSEFETANSEKLIACTNTGVCGLGVLFACRRPGLCVLDDYYMVNTADNQDQAAKQFLLPERGCIAYVFGMPASMTHIFVDGVLIGGLLGDRSYIVKELHRGTRKLEVSGPEVRANKTVEFACGSGSLVFLYIRTTRPGGIVGNYAVGISQPDASAGRNAVEKRQRMQLIY